uniref:Uncharacterized protein n=1 Tax=Strigamia maritima TaxID=126957 RepID=T1IZG6_STRMM
MILGIMEIVLLVGFLCVLPIESSVLTSSDKPNVTNSIKCVKNCSVSTLSLSISTSTSTASSFTRKRKSSDGQYRTNNILFSSKRRSRIRTFGVNRTTTATTTTTIKPDEIIDLGHDLLPQSSHYSEISVNHPYLSKPLAMHKRPAGKSDFMGLGVMPPRGSPAAKGPFKPAIIYKGLIRKQKPGMQFKRTPNGPPPLPPPLPLQPPKRPMARGREVSIPSEFASQFSMADPKTGTYKFGYDTGVVGEQSYRYETRDASGKVTGKYGYIDPGGVLREVNYVADAQGYRPVFVNRYRVDVNFPFVGPVPSKLKFS